MQLPDFIVIGERRSGTTTLAKWMEVHPDVFMHPKVDMGYFIDEDVVGQRVWFDGHVEYSKWPRSHSMEQYAEMFSAANGESAVGEKSADYLFWRPAHERIHEMVPNSKLIITIRDPVERAWSHYWNEVGKGRETLSFEEALVAEEERCRSSDYALDHLSYRTRGYYDESLRVLLKTFPQEQVLVTTLEQNRAMPQESLRRIYTFLDVDPSAGQSRAGEHVNANWTTIPSRFSRIPVVGWIELLLERFSGRVVRKLIRDPHRARDIQRKMWGIIRKTKEDMEMRPETRGLLREQYEPHIVMLEKMLDRSFRELRGAP